MRYKLALTRSVAALTAGAFALTAMGQVTLTGPRPTGTYTYYNTDVVIDDVELTGAPGSTFKVLVYNGSIQVGSGMYGFGIQGNGADGIDGDDIVPPQSGQPASPGFNVHLETRKCQNLVFGPSFPRQLGDASTADQLISDLEAYLACEASPGDRPMNISIVHGISLQGGDGGDGANGRDGDFDECTYIGAQDGFTATAGANGGFCTIVAAGNISISDGIETQGGNGGRGGSGGDGIIGRAGAGREGRQGGNGGRVFIRHSGAPSTATCSFGASFYRSGGVNTDGGHGGNGGLGGYGDPGPQPGGNGGPGGRGGDIRFFVNDLSFGAGPSCGGTGVSSYGGNGGSGGDGGPGQDSGCYPHFCPGQGWVDYSIAGSGGAIAGQGGNGGNAGRITASLTYDLSMSAYSGMGAVGGLGGTAGDSGRGGVAKGDGCDPGDCTGFIAYSAGQSMAGGEGGDGGQIFISGRDLSFGRVDSSQCGYVRASLSAQGGNASDAVHGAVPGIYCCEDPDAFGGLGAQGGPGGHGGDGANITLSYSGMLINPDGNAHFYTCGGEGSDGGDGSNGRPVPGSGGVAGSCGTTGTLVINNVSTTPTCGPCLYSDGAVGTLDLGSCGGS